MAEKKKTIGLCAAVAAVAILIILLLRGCGGTRVASPTEPPETDLTAAAEATTEAASVQTTAETTQPTEETTEPTETTEATEETEPEETEGSGGNSTPGGYNPDFGTDDDEDEDDKEEEEPFAAPTPGEQTNPYIEKLPQIPGQIDTVLIPLEGTVYYEIHGAANSVLTLENPDASIICGETTYQPDENGIITLPIPDSTEPITIQLSSAAEAETPYLLNFLGAPGSESNPEVLQSIAEIPVNLAEGDENGHYYVWPATETGELTLQPQAEGYVITVTIGDTVITNADSEDGSLTFEVEEGQEVVIHVVAVPVENTETGDDQESEGDQESEEDAPALVYPAVTDTILGTMADKGTILNPYVRYLTELPAEITTVKIPLDGYRVYDIYGAGESILTISDADAVVVYNSITFTPDENGVLTIAFDILEEESAARLAISCSGEEAEAFTLQFAYPEGSEKNPIVLETLDPVPVSLAGGEDNVRWYSWTAEKPGTLTMQIDSVIPETAACGIRLDVAEAVQTAAESLETTASLEVEAAQTVRIRVETAAGEDGTYPEAEITISGTFLLKSGTEENPIVLTIPEDAITAAAGESLHCTVQASGMTLTLTGENVSILFGETEYTSEDGRIVMPLGDAETATFVVTNLSESEAEYTVHIGYPLGSEQNPAQLTLGENTAATAEGPYHFAWTAETGGQLTIAAEEETAWTYTIENKTNGEAETVTGGEATQMVEVAAGDQLLIVIESDAETVCFTASFFDPTLGTEVNPIALELTAAKITLAAGETRYYRADADGADMTLKGSSVSVVMGREQLTLEEGVLTVRCRAEEGEVVLAFTNEDEEQGTYEISFAYPAGSDRNPVSLILGENAAAAEAGAEGFWFTWTAEIAGELTLSVPETTCWNCRIENLTDKAAAISEGTESSRTVTVSGGDQMMICVTPLDPEDPEALPGGELIVTAAFLDPTLGTEANPIVLNVPRDTVTVEAGETRYLRASAAGMTLTLAGENVTLVSGETTCAPENGVISLRCAETDGAAPIVFAVTNTADVAAEYTLSFTWPEGHRENPLELTLEEITCDLEAGVDGCCYTWTAEEDGVLTLTMEADKQWAVSLCSPAGEEPGETHTSADGVSVLTIEVKAGEDVRILVNTYDSAAPEVTPAGTVKFTASFEKTEK